MDEIKIDKDVPLPKSRVSRISAALKKMKIGDSFFKKELSISSVHACAKEQDIKICTRSMDGGVRVWRIK